MGYKPVTFKVFLIFCFITLTSDAKEAFKCDAFGNVGVRPTPIFFKSLSFSLSSAQEHYSQVKEALPFRIPSSMKTFQVFNSVLHHKLRTTRT